MDDDAGRRRLEFFGCILASATHQLNNILSTTDQVTGLLGDMLVAAEAGRPLDVPRIAGVKDRILAQVERGAALIENLNAFAHAADRPVGEIELGRLVERFLPLYERFAARRRLELVAGPLAADVHFQAGPLDCLHALFLALETVQPSGPSGGRATVAVVPSRRGGAVEVAAPDGEAAVDPAALAGLRERLAEIVPDLADADGGGGAEGSGTILVLRFGPDASGR